MYQFHRGGRAIHSPLFGAGEFTSSVGKQRPDTLASAQHGVTHRRVQSRGRKFRCRQQAVQGSFDAVLSVQHPTLKIIRCRRHR